MLTQEETEDHLVPALWQTVTAVTPADVNAKSAVPDSKQPNEEGNANRFHALLIRVRTVVHVPQKEEEGGRLRNVPVWRVSLEIAVRLAIFVLPTPVKMVARVRERESVPVLLDS